MINPRMYCKSCQAEHFLGDPKIIISEHKWGFYWKCSVCDTKNKWVRPNNKNGIITL
jgi:hypothetical protein